MSGPHPAPRVSVDALERHIYLTTSDPNEGKTDKRHLASTRWIADLLDVSPHTVIRWRQQGIPFYSADAAAQRLGVHPCLLWNDWFQLHNEEDMACT